MITLPVPLGLYFLGIVVAHRFAKTRGAACVLRFEVGTKAEASRETTGMAEYGLRLGAALCRRFAGGRICAGFQYDSERRFEKQQRKARGEREQLW